MQLFVDMDGVLADFDAHHEVVFGTRPCKNSDKVDWKAVRAVTDFYLALPPMSDLDQLWARTERHKPIILTGIPWSVPEAASNKQAWAAKHLGAHVEVRCCFAKEKCKHAAPIDDWEK